MNSFSVNGWAFPSDWSSQRRLEVASRLGYQGVELCLEAEGEFGLEQPLSAVEKLGRAARANGLQVTGLACGLYWQHSLSASNPAARERALGILKTQVRWAAALQAEAALVVPGAVLVPWDARSELVRYQDVGQRVADAIRAVAQEARSLGVLLCLENVWNGFLQSPLEMAEFIDQLGEPVRAYFDIGNVVRTGFPEDWILTLGARIARVHAKDYRRSAGTLDGFVPLLAGDVHWAGVREALFRIGYQGPITAEYLPPFREHPELLLQSTLASLKAVFA